MTVKDNAGSRRIMKWSDYSHSDPCIYISKDCLAVLARGLNIHYGIPYTTALNQVASRLCGISKDFNEYNNEHRFDISYEKAISTCPDIVERNIVRLSTETGLQKGLIEFILQNEEMCKTFKKEVIKIYEEKTSNPACSDTDLMLLLKQKIEDTKQN